MAATDRAHTILLSHLHNPYPKLALATIQSALAHQLANVTPTPIPLAAIAVSSPLYLAQPFTNEKLQSLMTAFRHAAHLKYRALVTQVASRSTIGAILERSMQSLISQWVDEVLQGVQGGNPVLRMASCSGLLLGIEDLKIGEKSERKEGIDVGSVRGSVEDEMIVALAEVMDIYAYNFTSDPSTVVEEWEKEFQPAGQDILSLALIIASQTLPLATQHKLEALPLPVLARLLSSTISSTFKHGTFLGSVSASVTLTPDQLVHISPISPVAQTLQSMTSSPLTASIASISRFTANILALLLESPSSRTEEAMFTVSDIFESLREMNKEVERNWISCPLADCAESQIASDSKEITKSIWTMLKTLLFSNIMLAESVLSNVIYVPPHTFATTPAVLAVQTLNTLSHLSFVISEFGGVTTTSKGFEQLKKTFYLALDILAQGEGQHGDAGTMAEEYVQHVCIALNSQRSETAATRPRQAKQAFVLASIEQLIPVLSDKCIRDWVWGICYPHLSDPSHRETYESAHSVILTIFAAHAQRQQLPSVQNQAVDTPSPSELPPSKIPTRNYRKGTNLAARLLSSIIPPGSEDTLSQSEGKGETTLILSHNNQSMSVNFVQRMVPFYAQCLINNSTDGKLSTPQLRLAYSALVRSASASSVMPEGTTNDQDALAWYCIQFLLDAIQQLSSSVADSSAKAKGKAREGDEKSTERYHRLCLTLISTVPSLPLPLLLRALDEIRSLVMLYPLEDGEAHQDQTGEKGGRMELLEALFHEIHKSTGDQEKEAALQWWYKYRSALVSENAGEDKRSQKVEGQNRLLGWIRNLESKRKGSLPKSSTNLRQDESQSDSALALRL